MIRLLSVANAIGGGAAVQEYLSSNNNNNNMDSVAWNKNKTEQKEKKREQVKAKNIWAH